MTMDEFRKYRDDRIRNLYPKPTDGGPQHSGANETADLDEVDQQSKLYICGLQGRLTHARQVREYAYAQDTNQLMDVWRAVVVGGSIGNAHEGIALNPGLSSEQIAEILQVPEGTLCTYWIRRHLSEHPNRG